MKIIHEDYVKLVLGEGNQQIMLVSGAGGGKTSSAENILEEYHDRGYLVVSVADPKDEYELAYAQFEPKERYHVKQLSKIGKEPIAKQVKLYHPFSFNLPKYSELPPFNIFTFPITDITRDEISFITESHSDLDIVRLLKNNVDDLGRDDSLFDLLLEVERKVKGKKRNIGGKDIAVPDASNFFLKTGTTGTIKTVSDLSSYFRPFLTDYFLAPKSFEMNLDIGAMLRDQKSYHVLAYKYIKDEKMKNFVSLMWFNTILNNRELCKCPIVFYIPEVRILTPFRGRGHKEFLADSLRTKLSKIRSFGKGGCSSVMETQVWTGVDEEVRDSSTETLFGNIGGLGDIERVAKILKWRKETVDMVSNLDSGQFIIKGKERLGSFIQIFMPSHMHKEEKYGFVEMFRQHYPEKMVKYKETVDLVKKAQDQHKNKAKELTRKRYLEVKKKIEDKVGAEKIKKSAETKLEEAKKEISSSKEKEKERLMKECLRLYGEGVLPDGKKATYRSIGKHLKINDKTVKGYIKQQQKSAETED